MKKTIDVFVGTPEKKSHQYNGGDYIAITGKTSVYAETRIDSLIESLTGLKKEHAGDYEDLYLDGVRDCGCYSMDCGCTPTLYLKGKRLETDLEYDLRIENEAKVIADRELADLKKYEELKQKFEKEKK